MNHLHRRLTSFRIFYSNFYRGFIGKKVSDPKEISMTKYFMYLFAIIFMLTASDCRKNPVGPIDDTPGRRDYTWFVDTIYAGGNIIRGIDGISQTDVWAISEAGDLSKTFYHFNGTKWSTDGINRSIAPEAIHAFASNDIWCVGLQGDIWHYNGTAWSSQAKIPPPNTNYYDLQDVDGNSSTDLYAVGNFSYNGGDLYPLMYHYDGNTWTRVNVQNILDCSLYKIRCYTQDKALVMGSTHKPDGSVPDSSKIYLFSGDNLQEIYSAVETVGSMGDIAKVPGGILLLKGRGLFFFDGTNQQELITIQNSEFGNSVVGRGIKDVFFGMWDGIAQYNGADIQYLYNFSDPNIRIDFIKVFPNSIFINSYNRTLQINIIFRGYLK